MLFRVIALSTAITCRHSTISCQVLCHHGGTASPLKDKNGKLPVLVFQPWPLLLKMNGCQHLCPQGADVEELESALEEQHFFSWETLVYLENKNYIKVIYVK